MKRSFVFGNGRTRLNIDFDEVKPYGLIYACNAVYRQYNPDYLVAVDNKMIVEITESNYHLHNKVYTNNSRYKKIKNLNYIEPNLGWSSGPSALLLATQLLPDEIYIFGFDYEGLNGKLNNVFSDTSNYKRSVDPATFYGNWYKQTETIIKDNPKIKFMRVTIPNFFETKWSFDNYYQMHYENFRKMLVEWEKIR